MILKAAIAIWLSQLQPARADLTEPYELRMKRLDGIAVAATRAALRATCLGEYGVPGCKPIARDVVELAAAVAYQVNKETNLSRRVQAGECASKECDPYRCRIDGEWSTCHAARGLGQQHRKAAWSDEYWANMAGLSQESTDQQMWEVAKRLAGGLWTCQTWEGAFANYAIGAGCRWKGAAERAIGAKEVERRIRVLMAQEPETLERFAGGV